MRRSYAGSGNPNFKAAGHKVCVTCGGSFHSYNKTRKYCSQDCYNATRPRTPKLPKPTRNLKYGKCPYCQVAKLPSKNAATCGESGCKKAHSDKRKRETATRNKRICVGCRKEFSAPPSSKQRYCGYNCHIKNGGARRAGMAAVKAAAVYGAKKDANHKEIVQALEDMGAHVIDTSGMGGGFPDLLVWDGSAWQLVEVKNSATAYGRRGLNMNQRLWAKDWKGGRVFLVYTSNDCKKLMAGRHTEVRSYG